MSTDKNRQLTELTPEQMAELRELDLTDSMFRFIVDNPRYFSACCEAKNKDQRRPVIRLDYQFLGS